MFPTSPHLYPKIIVRAKSVWSVRSVRQIVEDDASALALIERIWRQTGQQIDNDVRTAKSVRFTL